VPDYIKVVNCSNKGSPGIDRNDKCFAVITIFPFSKTDDDLHAKKQISSFKRKINTNLVARIKFANTGFAKER